MAVADPDLDQFRHDLAALIGVAVADVGMLPDRSHLETGGYHCGRSDLETIGRFHLPATLNVGSSTEDYSARQLRDRLTVDDRAAAIDCPDGWGNGGNPTWIRANNLILAQMRAGDPALAALRAMNFTPDGTLKRRYDTLHPEQAVIDTADTVTWHTHWEFWRDTLGTPGLRRTLARLLVIIKAAIDGRPVPPEEDDDMGSFGPTQLNADQTTLTIPPVQGGLADPRRVWLNVGADSFGQAYGLRIWGSNGDGNWFALGNATGLHKVASGAVLSFELPKGVRILTISRKAVNAGGTVVDPTKDLPVFAGSISVCFERM